MSNNHAKAGLGQRHSLHNVEVADAAARLALPVLDSNAGMLVRQLDNNSYWLVTTVTAGTPTYVDITSVGAEVASLVQQATDAAFAADAVSLLAAKQYTDDAVALLATDAAFQAFVLSLDQVDNTSDLNKPISTAVQAALDLKATLADLTTAVIPEPLDEGLVNRYFTPAREQVLTNLLALKADSQSVTDALALKADSQSVTDALALKADLAALVDYATTATLDSGLATKLDITGFTTLALGLDQVDNTSDLNKPISTAVQAALDLKQNLGGIATKVIDLSPTSAAITDDTSYSGWTSTVQGTTTDILWDDNTSTLTLNPGTWRVSVHVNADGGAIGMPFSSDSRVTTSLGSNSRTRQELATSVGVATQRRWVDEFIITVASNPSTLALSLALYSPANLTASFYFNATLVIEALNV